MLKTTSKARTFDKNVLFTNKRVLENTGQKQIFATENLNSKPIHLKEFRSRVELGKCITIDFGRTGIVAYNASTKDSETLTLPSLLELPNRPELNGFSILSEDAHLGIPKDNTGVSFSKAQYYADYQLLKFYEDCASNNIALRLFPQHMTPKIHAWSGLLKSDENDPISLYKYVLDHPKLTLKKPMKSFDPNSAEIKKMLEGRMHKNNSNRKLDFLRSQSLYGLSGSPTGRVHDCDCPLSNLVYNGLVHAIKNNLLSDSELEMLGAVRAKTKSSSGIYKGIFTKGDLRFDKVKMNVLCSIISPMFGQVAFNKMTGAYYMEPCIIERELGGPISWKFAKQYILEFKPQTRRGGTARSNIFHHFTKRYIIKEAKGTDYEGCFEQKYLDEDGKKRLVPSIVTYLEKGDPEAVKDTLGITLKIVDGDTVFFYENRKKCTDLVKKLFFLYRDFIDNSDINEITSNNWTEFNSHNKHNQTEMFN